MILFFLCIIGNDPPLVDYRYYKLDNCFFGALSAFFSHWDMTEKNEKNNDKKIYNNHNLTLINRLKYFNLLLDSAIESTEAQSKAFVNLSNNTRTGIYDLVLN